VTGRYPQLFGSGVPRGGPTGRALNSRFMGKNTVFDVVLGIVFGAAISRAINGSGPVSSRSWQASSS